MTGDNDGLSPHKTKTKPCSFSFLVLLSQLEKSSPRCLNESHRLSGEGDNQSCFAGYLLCGTTSLKE